MKELMDEKEIKLEFVPTSHKLADIFTNAIPADKFVYFKNILQLQLKGRC